MCDTAAFGYQMWVSPASRSDRVGSRRRAEYRKCGSGLSRTGTRPCSIEVVVVVVVAVERKEVEDGWALVSARRLWAVNHPVYQPVPCRPHADVVQETVRMHRMWSTSHQLKELLLGLLRLYIE